MGDEDFIGGWMDTDRKEYQDIEALRFRMGKRGRSNWTS